VTAELNASGDYGEPARFDLALANPPYYGDFQVAERFVAAAQRSLKPRTGRLLVVTKWPQWYQEFMARVWFNVEVLQGKNYAVVSALKS
jgi:16S rRNA (guanine1207-N2)-methyltransferase